jgi:hypothetical protein
VIPALSLAVALAAAPAASFRADFPAASVVDSPSGGHLVHASGFSAPGMGQTPEAAARAFLARYGAAFGITPRQTLAVKTGGEAGTAGVSAVHLERRIAGLPVFDGDVVVGVDGAGAVILVNAADVPARVTGRATLSRAAAIKAARAAIPGLKGAGPATAERGWRGHVDAVRPVWRVDFTADEPAGDWRSYVDAQTGKVLLRTDRRSRGLPGRRDAPTTVGAPR